MSSWLSRLRGEHQQLNEDHGAHASQVQQSRAKGHRFAVSMPKDPNVPVQRLQLHQKCLYERTMPGGAFVSAHVNRLQHGYYENKALHEGPLNNVYFVSVHFVFHPKDHHSHRFRAATIKVSVHGSSISFPDPEIQKGRYDAPRSHPRILKHAPELIYGAVSPEDLQWNFNLSSSLGVSQTPLSASLNPSGGVKKTYKVYDMMSIQGSLRVLKSPLGSAFDVDDAMAVWTLEENVTQRSGLPREFDFVMLVHKPDDVGDVHMTVDLDATISSWHGDYPEWYTNLSKFLPNVDFTLDMDTEIGQKFLPERPGRGFNFADLPHALDQYVSMPGTVYPTADRTSDESKAGDEGWQRYRNYEPRRSTNEYRVSAAAPATSPKPMSPEEQIANWGQRVAPASVSSPAQGQFLLPDTLNLKVILEHSSPRSPPSSTQDPARRRSIRRRRSRSELKEYGIQQALHALAGDTLKGNGKSTPKRAVKTAEARNMEPTVDGGRT